jgi:hypothetical protein
MRAGCEEAENKDGETLFFADFFIFFTKMKNLKTDWSAD